MSTSYRKSWVLCLSGASKAMAKLDDALDNKSPDAEVLRPLIECLWWVCATDESLMEEYSNEWKEHLRPERSELSEIILGLRWARNRMTHQICQWDIARPPFVWEDAEFLYPFENADRRYDRGRDQYQLHLQGQDARAALKRVLSEIKTKAVASLSP